MHRKEHLVLFISIVLSVLFLPMPANANAGLPMIMIAWPIFWLAFIPIVLIEWAVMRHLLPTISKRSLLWNITLANAVSTVIGIPVTWFALVALEFLLTTSPFALLYVSVQHALSDTTWAKAFEILITAPWLYPFDGQTMNPIPFALILLFVPFFFVSYWSESRFIQWRLRNMPSSTPPNLGVAVWKANLASYAFLAVATVAYFVCTHIFPELSISRLWNFIYLKIHPWVD